MTKIEKGVFSHPKYLALGEKPDRKAAQWVLDEITEEVLKGLTAQEICDAVRMVYDDTVPEYLAKPHNRDIIDELVEFMDMLPEGSEVLDVGCGPGRDALFMAVGDPDFRKTLMGRKGPDGRTTLDKYPVPTKIFHVTAIDDSSKMLDAAVKKREKLIEEGLLPLESDIDKMSPRFCFEGMHNIDPRYFGPFDAVWSCTAFATHTPQELLRPGMESVAGHVKPYGLFFTSYTNGKADGRYNKLLLSETGRIKYFSQPDPQVIADLAHDYGLSLLKETVSDMVVVDKETGAPRVLKKDLFASQFFLKNA